MDASQIPKAKLVALGLGLAYVAIAVHYQLEPMGLLWYAVATFVAECLIWMPEQLGATTGMGGGHGHRGVDTETPGCVVAAFGWLMLLAVPLVYWGF